MIDGLTPAIEDCKRRAGIEVEILDTNLVVDIVPVGCYHIGHHHFFERHPKFENVGIRAENGIRAFGVQSKFVGASLERFAQGPDRIGNHGIPQDPTKFRSLEIQDFEIVTSRIPTHIVVPLKLHGGVLIGGGRIVDQANGAYCLGTKIGEAVDKVEVQVVAQGLITGQNRRINIAMRQGIYVGFDPKAIRKTHGIFTGSVAVQIVPVEPGAL